MIYFYLSNHMYHIVTYVYKDSICVINFNSYSNIIMIIKIWYKKDGCYSWVFMFWCSRSKDRQPTSDINLFNSFHNYRKSVWPFVFWCMKRVYLDMIYMIWWWSLGLDFLLISLFWINYYIICKFKHPKNFIKSFHSHIRRTRFILSLGWNVYG